MVVLTTDRDEKFLRQGDLRHRTLVHGKSLEQLGSVADGFRVLHDHSNRAGLGTVGDLNPVTGQT